MSRQLPSAARSPTSPLKTLTWTPWIWVETSPGHWLKTRRGQSQRVSSMGQNDVGTRNRELLYNEVAYHPGDYYVLLYNFPH